MHAFGDVNILIDAVVLSERSRSNHLEVSDTRETIRRIENITPDTEVFADETASYALNACTATIELLEFIADRDTMHIQNIGSYLTDTIDFKIQEVGTLTEQEIDEHPLIQEARSFLLNLSTQK